MKYIKTLVCFIFILLLFNIFFPSITGNIIFNKKQKSTHLYSNFSNNGDWNIEQIDTDGNVGRGISMKIDSKNNPHISYYDRTNDALKYATWSAEGWHIETVDKHTAFYNSICLDSKDRPSIAYAYFHQYPCVTKIFLKYAHWNGKYWEKEIVDNFETGAGSYTSLVIDKEDKPHISYGFTHKEAPFVDPGLRYAYKSHSNWEIEEIETKSPPYSQITFDKFGKLYLCYVDKNYKDLILSQRIDNIWEKEVIYTENNDYQDIGGEFSIVFDSKNNPHISFTRRTPYGGTSDRLRYLHKQNGNWEITLIDDNKSKYVPSNSIALDANDNPHISYNLAFKNSDDVLKYASFDGVSWNIEILSSSSEVYHGGYCSLVFDNFYRPHISFYNSHYSGGLFYVRLLSGNPPETPQKPIGETDGLSGKEYTYSTSTADPDEHSIYYIFDWDAGGISEYSEWIGPYKSNEEAEISHSWKKHGVYQIKVKSKDEFGMMSEWSEPLTVTIAKIRFIDRLIIPNFLLTIKKCIYRFI